MVRGVPCASRRQHILQMMVIVPPEGEMDKEILVVEDEPQLARLVEMHLRDAGCRVEVALTGAKGMSRASKRRFDLMVLDLMLPDMDGLDVCRELRTQRNYTPILILTARSAEVDRVLGLELGADDYLTKPFSVRELVARVKAILRRIDRMNDEQAGSEPLEFEDLTIDREKRRVSIRGNGVRLTAKEYDLLLQFARNPGRVYTRSQLLDLVWGYGEGNYEHTVNSHINRLRGKIEDDPSEPRFIRTVWGVGYRFFDPAMAGGGPRGTERRANRSPRPKERLTKMTRLYKKLSAALFGLFLIVGGVTLLVTLVTSYLYQREVQQRIHHDLAANVVKEKLLIVDGEIAQDALENVFHSMMVINPTIELYLLDRSGGILAFKAPPGKVKLAQVALDPIREYIYENTSGATDASRSSAMTRATRIARISSLQRRSFATDGSRDTCTSCSPVSNSFLSPRCCAAATFSVQVPWRSPESPRWPLLARSCYLVD
jgi:DNA-binding response OmpR family regulator